MTAVPGRDGTGGLRPQWCQQGFGGRWPAPPARAGSCCRSRQAVTHAKSHPRQLATVSLPTPKPLTGAACCPQLHPLLLLPQAGPPPPARTPGWAPRPLLTRQTLGPPSLLSRVAPAQLLPAQNIFTLTSPLSPRLSLPGPAAPYRGSPRPELPLSPSCPHEPVHAPSLHSRCLHLGLPRASLPSTDPMRQPAQAGSGLRALLPAAHGVPLPSTPPQHPCSQPHARLLPSPRSQKDTSTPRC